MLGIVRPTKKHSNIENRNTELPFCTPVLAVAWLRTTSEACSIGGRYRVRAYLTGNARCRWCKAAEETMEHVVFNDCGAQIVVDTSLFQPNAYYFQQLHSELILVLVKTVSIQSCEKWEMLLRISRRLIYKIAD